jgi:drug/metabolite transporter (DMT)-like permease
MTAPAVGHVQRPLSGAFIYMAGLFLLALLGVFVKWLDGAYPVGELILFRNVFSLPIVVALLMRQGGLRTLHTRRPLDFLFRSSCGLFSMAMFYTAITMIPLADATILHTSAPLLVAALSAPFLGERVGWRRWTAVIVGLCGVAILVRPGAEGVVSLGHLIAALSAVGSAFVSIWLRKLSRTESTVAMVAYYNLISIAVAAVWVLVVDWRTPTPLDLALLVGFGLVGGLSQYLMTIAFRYAEVATLAPMEYTVFIHAAAFGLIIWGETLTWTTVIGALIIAGSGMFVVWREARVRRG